MTGGSLAALLPLIVSGYFFILLVYPLRYFAVRIEGQQLFFASAGAGMILGSLFFLMGGFAETTTCFRGFCWLPTLKKSIDENIPFSHASRLVLTMGGSIVLALLANFLIRVLLWHRRSAWPSGSEAAEVVFSWWADRLGSPLAKLLRRAVNEQRLVMVTLQSRKVYCGRVMEVPSNLDDEGSYFEILPKFSSYRNKDTLRLGEKTPYPALDLWLSQQGLESKQDVLKDVTKKLASADSGSRPIFEEAAEKVSAEIDRLTAEIASYGYSIKVSPDDWLKVIPVSEIESITFFDSEAYSSWFNPESGKVPPTANDDSGPGDG